MLIAGRQLIVEAIKDEKEFEKILVQQDSSPQLTELVSLARQHNIHVQFVPKIKLDKITRANHQGVVGFVSEIVNKDLQEVIDNVLLENRNPFLIVLDGVTDVRNLGAIARTAYGMGIDALVLPQRNSAPVNDIAIKTSAGALQHLAVCRVPNTVVAIKDIKINGILTIGLDENAKHSIADAPKNTALALVVGDEGIGISDAVKKLLDDVYSIPINNLDSYNVSVATAIALYEVKCK